MTLAILYLLFILPLVFSGFFRGNQVSTVAISIISSKLELLLHLRVSAELSFFQLKKLPNFHFRQGEVTTADQDVFVVRERFCFHDINLCFREAIVKKKPNLMK